MFIRVLKSIRYADFSVWQLCFGKEGQSEARDDTHSDG
jgi:hypothetical protein